MFTIKNKKNFHARTHARILCIRESFDSKIYNDNYHDDDDEYNIINEIDMSDYDTLQDLD